MDGSNMTRILTWKDSMSRPNAITIDYLADRLYWADAHFGHIAFSDYEGHHRHTVISGEKVAHILALSIFDDYVFWSDAYLKAIMRANKLNGSDLMTLRHSTHQMYDLSVYHNLRQLPYNNPCGENNGGCSHLCLIAPREDRKVSFDSVPEDQLTTYKCACPNPLYLLSDGRTCDRKYRIFSSSLPPILVILSVLAFGGIWMLYVRGKRFGKIGITPNLSNAKQSGGFSNPNYDTKCEHIGKILNYV